MRLPSALLTALTLLVLARPAEARFDWLRQIVDSLGRGASLRISEGRPSRVHGHFRPSDASVWVWRGHHPLRTLVHELLHRTTACRAPGYLPAVRALTGDLEIDEGLTSYFADRALESAHLAPAIAVPPPGAPFGVRRAWARELRTAAARAIEQGFGRKIATFDVHVLSEKPFGRVYARHSGGIWLRPEDGPSYPASQDLVRQIVALVGEEPVRRAYFDGDVTGLRAALVQTRARAPHLRLPRSIDLRPPR